uniref:Secreted protein n=2 Tax=Aegilops tauschii TaxID=37682 RepID=A0A452YWD0_AEGTS
MRVLAVVNSVCRAAILLRLLLTLESKKASISATFAPSSLIKASLHDCNTDENRGKFLCAYKPSSTTLAPVTLVSESS